MGSAKGQALRAEVQTMLEKDALQEVVDGSPGFYSQLFLVRKASGGWRPVIDLSTLNGFVFKEVPEILPRQQDLPVQGAVFRSLHSSSGVHQSFHHHLLMGSQDRHPSPSLYGRLADPGRLGGNPSSPPRQTPRSLPGSGDRGKSREVLSAALSETGISKHGHRHQSPQSLPIRRKDSKAEEGCETFPQSRGTLIPIMASSPRSPLLPNPSRSQQPPQNEIPPVVTQVSVESRTRLPGHPDPHGICGTSGPQLVGGRREPTKGSGSSRPFPGFHAVFGRIKQRVGGPHSEPQDLGPVVRIRKVPSHKPARNEGRIPGSSEVPPSPGGPLGGGDERQHHGRGLYQQAGRYLFGTAIPSCSRDPEMVRSPLDLTSGSLHSRQKECARPQSEQSDADSEYRVVFGSSDSQQSPDFVGFPDSGSVRYGAEHQAPAVLLPSPGPQGFLAGCLPTTVGQRRCVRLSPVLSDEEGTQQDQNIGQSLDDLDSSAMASRRMVPGPSAAPHGDPEGAPSTS
ncbi:uncharacterized protein [Palaemon carinicauda]|uniref:uncharacterized protein n=1 Tax=Palaemon carinicauda TaxID=392227 RepID=UPI0035B67B84